MGNALVAGRLDNGGTVEINPIDFVLLAMGICLLFMWLDK